MCAGLLRGGILCELERGLRVCDGYLCTTSLTYDGVLLRQWWHKQDLLYVLCILAGNQ